MGAFLAKFGPLLQIVATFIVGTNVAVVTGYLSFLPTKVSGVIIVVFVALQAALAQYQKTHNPDGQSATIAYRPPV